MSHYKLSSPDSEKLDIGKVVTMPMSPDLGLYTKSKKCDVPRRVRRTQYNVRVDLVASVNAAVDQAGTNLNQLIFDFLRNLTIEIMEISQAETADEITGGEVALTG